MSSNVHYDIIQLHQFLLSDSTFQASIALLICKVKSHWGICNLHAMFDTQKLYTVEINSIMLYQYQKLLKVHN